MSLSSTLKRHAKLIKFNFGLLSSFIGFNATSLVAFAARGKGGGAAGAGGDGAANFTAYTGKAGNMGTLSNLFASFIGPLQGLAAVLLIIFAIILGIKIGMAAVTSNPQGREGAMVGLFFIILAGAVVIHAKEIVGMSAGLSGV